MKRFAVPITFLAAAAALLTACSGATPAADTHHIAATASSTPTAAVSSLTSHLPFATPTAKIRSSTTPTTGPATTATPAVRTPADTQAAICAIVQPGTYSDPGVHCGVQNLHDSTADPAWYYGLIGGFNSQHQPATDLDVFIVNLTSHAVAGPSNIGFCQAGGPGKGLPVGGYTAVPTAILTSFGLAPCPTVTQAPAPVPVPVTSLPSFKPPTSVTVDSFAGRWTGHETVLVIVGANGTISYADLTKCPSCSFATAPISTATFVIKLIQGITGEAIFTSSTDPAVYAVGSDALMDFAPGSSDHILAVTVLGRDFTLCDAAAAGQCGA